MKILKKFKTTNKTNFKNPINKVSPVNNTGSFVESEATCVIAKVQLSIVCPGVKNKQTAKSPIENGSISLIFFVLKPCGDP